MTSLYAVKQAINSKTKGYVFSRQLEIFHHFSLHVPQTNRQV